ACRLFAQQQPDSQVWTNDPGELVLLNFKKRGKTLTANFSKSTVVNQDAETTLEASGVFECVILN
ncbi:hypothetical protein N9B45_02535, partial [bacterium]|nr:hypothetical protein [bacterium]